MTAPAPERKDERRVMRGSKNQVGGCHKGLHFSTSMCWIVDPCEDVCPLEAAAFREQQKKVKG